MNVAVEAVFAAAREVRRFDTHRGMLKIEEKAPGDLVTNADLASERAAIEVLQERFPNDGVLSEECGSFGPMDSCWVLDPIDGTTNFVHALPEFAISLAWCQDGDSKIGVILDVRRDELYVAEKGRGAYCEQRRMRVSKTRRFADALIASTGSAGTSDWRWKFLAEASRKSSGIRRIGSGTLDFALTARGCLDASFGANLSYWDCAAGALMVREAGGVFFSDLEGGSEMAFGEKVGLCLYGSRHVVGTLRRMASRHCEEEARGVDS